MIRSHKDSRQWLRATLTFKGKSAPGQPGPSGSQPHLSLSAPHNCLGAESVCHTAWTGRVSEWTPESSDVGVPGKAGAQGVLPSWGGD